jgi:hypothetical protein
MTAQNVRYALLAFSLLLSACARQTQVVPSTATLPPPPETNSPPTKAPAETHLPQDAALFGAIPQAEIQAYSLEPVASAIFIKAMDAFIANGGILEYHVTRVTIFPAGDGSLYAEITYNVRTANTSWLADGGTQTDDNWINDKCNRFDFVTTETVFQLKNRRTCN